MFFPRIVGAASKNALRAKRANAALLAKAAAQSVAVKGACAVLLALWECGD